MAPRLIAIAALGTILTGCVSQGKYNALKLEKDQLTEQLAASETAKSRAEAEAGSYKTQLDALLKAQGDSGSYAQKLLSENDTLRKQYDDLMSRYNDLANKQIAQTGGPIAEEVASALEKWAQEHPEMAEFDRQHGLIKFKSDVTFASGSAELTPQAKTVIGTLAPILNTGRAANYEMLVAGHTDNRRVAIDATKRLHPDNWYLSAHRAIAVSEALMTHGVSPARLGALGYADQRPIASNSTSAGMAKNRRVEVLLLPTTYRAGGNFAEATTPPAKRTTPTVRAKGADLNKDTVRTDQAPVFTK